MFGEKGRKRGCNIIRSSGAVRRGYAVKMHATEYDVEIGDRVNPLSRVFTQYVMVKAATPCYETIVLPT